MNKENTKDIIITDWDISRMDNVLQTSTYNNKNIIKIYLKNDKPNTHKNFLNNFKKKYGLIPYEYIDNEGCINYYVLKSDFKKEKEVIKNKSKRRESFEFFNLHYYNLYSDDEEITQRDLNLNTKEILKYLNKEIKPQFNNIDIGFRIIRFEPYSPSYYNYSDDTIDIVIQVYDKLKLIKYLLTYEYEIQKELDKNKSGIGYIATTCENINMVIQRLIENDDLDIIACNALIYINLPFLFNELCNLHMDGDIIKDIYNKKQGDINGE